MQSRPRRPFVLSALPVRRGPTSRRSRARGSSSATAASSRTRTLVIDGNKIVQAGAGRGGARGRHARQPRRQDRDAGDHRHPRPSQPDARKLIRDLKQRAYSGVSAAHEHGTGPLRTHARHAERNDSRRGAFLQRRTRHHQPEPGRITAPHWITTEAEGRKAVQDIAAKKVDIIKIWVDDRDGKFKKLTPELYGADHRRGAQGRPPRHRAHLRPGGCARG